MRPYRKAAFALPMLACAVFINLAALATRASAAELFVFKSAHCPSCVAWEREIGHSYTATTEGQRLPLRRFDVDGGASSLADSHAVEVTPTFILIERGHEVGRIEGYSGGRKFWTDLHALLARLHGAG